MKRLGKDLILLIIMGILYMEVELLWRGRTDFSMMIVGGLCGVLIGELNEHNFFYGRKIYQQSLIGTLIVLVLEFTSGCILNIILKLNVWDYSDMPCNILGQICLPYAIIWFLFMPAVIYVDDLLRHYLFKEDMPRKIKEYYKDLFLLR